ncbi:MAG: hypothetical protein JWM14_500 [Chitinophagaceae bacterium]|nr:hypothetical protein [Chitinophagaceae bacterium]
MRRSTSYLTTIALLCLIIIFLLLSCRPEHHDPQPYGYWNVPDGATAVIENTNLSGKGLLTNRAYTTWIIRGQVTMDDLSIVGRIILAQGASLHVNGLVNVAGGANLTVQGEMTCTTLTQVGNIYYNEANVEVSGQYTAAGGTSTYLQNSLIKVNDLRLQGAVYALENDHTQATNVFSIFYFNGTNLYLNRASGTTVCGPVLFTYNDDQGSSGISLNDYTNATMTAKPDLRTIYSLPSNISFYRYADQNCTPVTIAPSPF